MEKSFFEGARIFFQLLPIREKEMRPSFLPRKRERAANSTIAYNSLSDAIRMDCLTLVSCNALPLIRHSFGITHHSSPRFNLLTLHVSIISITVCTYGCFVSPLKRVLAFSFFLSLSSIFCYCCSRVSCHFLQFLELNISFYCIFSRRIFVVNNRVFFPHKLS